MTQIRVSRCQLNAQGQCRFGARCCRADWHERFTSVPCPWGDATHALDMDEGEIYGATRVRCLTCWCEGPSADTPEEALRLWESRSAGRVLRLVQEVP